MGWHKRVSPLRLDVGTSGPLRYGPEAIRLNLAGLPEEGAARTRQRSWRRAPAPVVAQVLMRSQGVSGSRVLEGGSAVGQHQRVRRPSTTPRSVASRVQTSTS